MTFFATQTCQRFALCFAVKLHCHHLIEHRLPEKCDIIMGIGRELGTAMIVVEIVVFIGGFIIEHKIKIRCHGAAIDGLSYGFQVMMASLPKI